MDKIDLQITEIHKQEFVNLQSSKLILRFTGNSVNTSLVNTLRRICYDYIPTYAFHPSNINIEKNTSIYNNDYMKLRLSAITIPNILNKIFYLDDQYWLGADYRNPDRLKHPDDKKVLELYINAVNNSKERLDVTTLQAKVFEDGVEMKDKFDPNFPMLLVRLNPGEVFSARCVGVLGVAKISSGSIWQGAGNTYLKEFSDHEFTLTVESQGQYDEYELLHKACRVLKEKINITKKLIEDKYEIYNSAITEKSALKIVLDNEDHTLGGIINEYLQENVNVIFSGVAKPNPLNDSMIIEFQTLPGKKSAVDHFLDNLNNIVLLFDEVQTQIENIGGTYIMYATFDKKSNTKKSKK